MKKILTIAAPLAVLAIILVPVFTFAQIPPTSGGNPPTSGGNPPTSGGNPISIGITLTNPFKVGNNLQDILVSILDNFVLPVGGILCVLAFIWAGFSYVIAGGDQTKIKNAHRMLLYAAVGTALILGAKTLQLVVQTTINGLK